MRKYIGIAGMVVFWVSTFALVTMLLRWKQQVKRQQEAEQTAAAEQDPAEEGPAAEPDGEERPPPPTAEEAQRARQKGRALFDLPQPFSVSEISNIMNELKQEREQSKKRAGAMDLRETELRSLEQDLIQRRAELLELAREVGGQAARIDEPSATPKASPPSPEAFKKLAQVYASMEEQVASRALLSDSDSDAAAILLQMPQKDAAKILSFFPEDRLHDVTEAMKLQSK